MDKKEQTVKVVEVLLMLLQVGTFPGDVAEAVHASTKFLTQMKESLEHDKR